jgi:hypothetical protein
MDWTTIGAPPPTGTRPMKTWRVFLRGMESEGPKFLPRGLGVEIREKITRFFPQQGNSFFYEINSFS